MKIRHANTSDLKKIMQIYADAVLFMRESGNMHQWQDGYPKRELIERDINSKNCYVCLEEEKIAAVFCYFQGGEPTYKKIYDGSWLSDEPYGVIHRIAVEKKFHGKGAAKECYRYCLDKCANLRIDTHRDNLPMQKSLSKFGFRYCGIIYLENGDERLAYQIEKEV